MTVTDGEWTRKVNLNQRPTVGQWTWYYKDFWKVTILNNVGKDNYIVLCNKKNNLICIDKSVYETLGTLD